MTQLLVSVRNSAEAQIALDGGVSWIDVKEPNQGSLGRTPLAGRRDIARCVGSAAGLSLALGELSQLPPSRDEPRLAAAELETVGYQYAKLGLSQCRSMPDWQPRWHAVIERFAPETSAVAVIYADWQSASAPEPSQVYELLSHPRCGALLVDTWDKSQGSLLAHWSKEELAEMISTARQHNKLAVVAGSLTAKDIPQLLALGPDVIAVRGAATGGDRRGMLDSACVRQLVALVECPAPRRQGTR